MILPERRGSQDSIEEEDEEEETVNKAEEELRGLFQVANKAEGVAPMALNMDYKAVLNDGLEDEFTEKPSSGMMVVLDAPNICMQFGDNKKFVYAGLQIAVDYFLELGCKIIS